jgi:hypothetical protein
LRELLLTLDGNESELEHHTVSVALAPGPDQVKNAVVRPDSLPYLFVHSYALRRTFTARERLSSLMKLSILREPA